MPGVWRAAASCEFRLRSKVSPAAFDILTRSSFTKPKSWGRGLQYRKSWKTESFAKPRFQRQLPYSAKRICRIMSCAMAVKLLPKHQATASVSAANTALSSFERQLQDAAPVCSLGVDAASSIIDVDPRRMHCRPALGRPQLVPLRHRIVPHASHFSSLSCAPNPTLRRVQGSPASEPVSLFMKRPLCGPAAAQ